MHIVALHDGEAVLLVRWVLLSFWSCFPPLKACI